MEFNAKDAWEKCRQIIRDNITPEQYKTIFAHVEYNNFKPADNSLTLSVPSAFLPEIIDQKYADIMRTTLQRVFGAKISLFYCILKVQTPATHTVEKATLTPTPHTPHPTTTTPLTPETTPQELDSQLKSTYNFDTYLEGENNKFARAIGMSIAERPEKNTFNPMFIYGPSGCGKTHLINAIGLKIKELHPQRRVLYVSAHLFMHQWTEAVRKNVRNDFVAFYQTIDVLIIDDIQELSGKKDTQNTFFHIFNHLIMNNKQIILAADRPPVAIQDLEDRLLTRFKWGLIAEIEKPTKQLRYSILTAKVNQEGLSIPKNVLNFISENIDESVRDLEGMINSLMAYSLYLNCRIDMDLANKIMPKFKAGVISDTNYTFNDIVGKVCDHFGVTQEQLCSRSRTQPLAYIRQLTMYMASKLTTETHNMIGLNLGGRNHATVVHSIKQISELATFDIKTQNDIEAIQEML